MDEGKTTVGSLALREKQPRIITIAAAEQPENISFMVVTSEVLRYPMPSNVVSDDNPLNHWKQEVGNAFAKLISNTTLVMPVLLIHPGAVSPVFSS